MRVCITVNCGTMRDTTAAISVTMTGTATSRIPDSCGSSRSAMTTPPTIIIGAATSIVHDICTSIWTCCTSLVMRVMSEGGPKCATSCAE